MNNGFVQIEISDHGSLMKACDLLHDAQCDISSITFNADLGSWKATFKREFFEDPTLMQHEPRLFIFTKHTFPLITSQLSLDGVTACKIEDKADIGTYMFNECRLNDQAYVLWFCEDMKITLTFAGTPRGQLRDLNRLEEKVSYFTFRNPFRK